jgi:hypothetical protein
MTMNLVGIAGLPVGEAPAEPPLTDDEQRALMWTSLAAFGVAAVVGYFLGKRLV